MFKKIYNSLKYHWKIKKIPLCWAFKLCGKRVPRNLKWIIGADTDWRVPSDDDWKELEMHLGMSQAQADSTGWRGTNEGTKLKSGGSSGFNALMSGYRYTDGSFYSLGSYAYFWSSSASSSSLAWRRYLVTSYSTVNWNNGNKAFGFSVRLVRDLTSAEKLEDDGYKLDDYVGNDGKTYSAIKIGDQGWITENLKETKYNDETTIPRITNNTDWANDTTGARCEYNNDADSESDTHGYLYNWYAVDNAKNIVNPSGKKISAFKPRTMWFN